MCQALQSAGLQSMFAVYLLQVAAGVVAPLPLIPPPEAGKNFFKALSTLMLVVVIARWIAVGGTLAAALTTPETRVIVERIAALSGHGLFFWQRIGIGLAIPLALALMVRSTAKLGSNQSATGILYVGVAFVIIGELIARYLFLMTGLPL